MRRRSVAAGAGLGLGALVGAPAVAQGEDIRVTNLNTSGPGSLREAIQDARVDADFDRITFKSKLSGTIDVNEDDTPFLTGLYIEGGDLEIVGPGARKLTLSGEHDSRVISLGATFDMLPPIDVEISGLRIVDGVSGTGQGGGGIFSMGEVGLTLSRVAIEGNATISDESGGGLAMYPSIPADDPTLVVENSTISANTSDADGGGIFATVSEGFVRNSTISGNSAFDEGGGVYMTPYQSFEFRNSTVTDNEAVIGGGLYESGSADLDLRGVISAGNTAPTDPDIEGEPWTAAFSLIEDVGGADIDPSGGGNIFGVAPKLKPLRNNGGPTDTHAFKKSPAKNKGPGDAPNSDQRGAPRKGQADIGSYELTKCKGVVVNRVGTPGKDKLKGTKKKDGILGLGGNDKLSGKKGKDGLCGGSGKDKLKGGPGKDKLDGGPGKDKEIQ